MNWNDLIYFLGLVKHQTLTACSEHLNVQHSTVSRRLTQLEQALDVKLFDRMGKRYVLTVEGRRLYKQALEIEKNILIFERMANDQHTMRGCVIVSAPPVLANELLMPALANFSKQYPNIHIEMQGVVNISDLHRKEADIALRLQRPIQEDLVIKTITHLSYGLFAHNDYLKETPSSQWQLVDFKANSRLIKWLQQLIQYHDYTVAFSSNDLYTVQHAILQKIGIGILPYFLANKMSNIVAINPINRIPLTSDIDIANCREDKLLQQCYPLYLVMHQDIRHSARVRAVADWLIETINH